MKALSFLCALVVCICWAAFASSGDTVTVHFSSPVVVAGTTLPAGNVEIDVNRGNSNAMLFFRSDSGVTVATVANRVSDSFERRNDATVTLTRDNGVLHIDHVWLPDGSGFALIELGK